jgi:uncharacterized membrane protein YgcG
MSLVARFAAATLTTLAFAASAEAGVKPIAGSAPIGLRAFLLRADEPARESFPRTPSFAWSPVRGALRYEFQLSTSSVFRDNGIVYHDAKVRSPAVSVPLTLPWITGKPYSLYARVRAVLPKRVTPWSAPFGFNMRWVSIAQPLSTYPGLLRWSPVEGATGYDVWLLDARKVFTVGTNVADQREYYTFHQNALWTSTVHWRVRAVRTLYGQRDNAMPAVSYGPWSPVYTAVNPPFSVGALTASATVSDVISDAAVSPAHRLMPAFAFSGNTSIFGTAEELYRVYVFTDSDCVNVVYRGAVVGGPAYAPRPLGPLALPATQTDVAKARSQYLKDGDEGKTYAADGSLVKTTESDTPAESGGTGSAGGEAGSGSNGNQSGASGGSSGGGASDGPAATGGQAGSGTSAPSEQTKAGARVDLWDTDQWPRGGYFWTVVPVEATSPDSFETTLLGPAAKGATTLELGSISGLATSDSVTIGSGSTNETVKVLSISGTTVTLAAPLVNAHGSGEPVERTSGQLVYRDLELAQEACADGRVMRFGKQSEPALMGNGAPFASGLSPTGRLTAASRDSAAFYGPPLVAWAPALGADAYEVQWGKTAYPFRPEASGKNGKVGITTSATSVALPLRPGTWYYRVRGINFSIPGTANQMSWSEPVKVVVTRPRFAVVP